MSLIKTVAQQVKMQNQYLKFYLNTKPGLSNLSTKNKLSDRFSGLKSRQVAGRIFTGRISDSNAEQIFKTGTGL